MKSIIPIFKINHELEVLEQNEEWDKARELLYNEWNTDKSDLEKLLRVGTECWYVLTYWERIKSDGLCREMFSITLTEMKNCGDIRFRTSDSFLWVFGYMISLFPYWFNDFDGDIYRWEDHGKCMIRQAVQLQPENIIAKMLCLVEGSAEYERACVGVRDILSDYFPGNSAIEKYFKEVLNRNP